MKLLKSYLQVVLFSLLFFASPSASIGSTPEAIEGNIDDVARAIQTYFPKVKGKIRAVEGDRLEIDFGSGQGLAEGILLTVFREGAPFHHPITGATLGRHEERISTIEVLRFDPPRLIAHRLESTQEIVVGDQVRLPATRIPLAIAINSEGGEPFLMNELVAALTDTGRFKIDPLLPGAGFKEAFERENRYYIALATSRDGEKFSMGLKIQNAVTGKSLARLAVLINQSQESDLILEHLQYQLFEQRQKK